MITRNYQMDESTDVTRSWTGGSFERRRPVLGADLLIRPTVPPRVLIVDDDPVFQRLMARIAVKESLNITAVGSMEELDGIADWNFDVAIIDYLLGPVTGIDLVRYLENASTCPPVVLVSHTRKIETNVWPVSVRDFVHKALGPYAVLDAAYEVFEIDRITQKIHGGNRKRSAS
jgi:CheY-like chemotaxis protein